MQLNVKPRTLLTTLAELAGFGLISNGIWQISEPAGWISAGVSLVLVGVLQA